MAAAESISCIVYDLDGTLIDSAADIAAAVNRVRESYGLEVLSVVDVTPLIGDGTRRLLERAVFGLCEQRHLRPARVLPKSGADLDEVFDRYMEVYRDEPVVRTTLYPGAEIMLRFWRKQGTAQVVLTNKPHGLAVEVLKRLEIHSLLDLVVGRGGRDDQGREIPSKPDPAVIDYILVQTGAPREETYFVGDGLPDVATAKSAGIEMIAVLGGYTDADRLVAAVPDLDLAVISLKDADLLLRRRAGLA